MIYTVPAFFTEVFHIFQYLNKNFREILFGNHLSLQAEAFTHIHEMGGKRKGPGNNRPLPVRR